MQHADRLHKNLPSDGDVKSEKKSKVEEEEKTSVPAAHRGDIGAQAELVGVANANHVANSCANVAEIACPWHLHYRQWYRPKASDSFCSIVFSYLFLFLLYLFFVCVLCALSCIFYHLCALIIKWNYEQAPLANMNNRRAAGVAFLFQRLYEYHLSIYKFPT